MYFSDRVTLIAARTALDSIGNSVIEELRTEVWADIISVGRSEFAAAGAHGLKPALMLKVHTCDYAGQTQVLVGTRQLSVYRTFCKGEITELYLEEKGGNRDGGKHQP